MRKIGTTFVFILTAATLMGCAPLVIGAGGAVIADKVVEDQQGGDGLF